MICAALIGDLENGSLDEQQLEQELLKQLVQLLMLRQVLR